jgi:UDP-glucose 4-epimerase
VAAAPGADFRDSVLGSLQLLERIADISPSSKIVFCSSAAVYGNQSTSYLSETDCPAPVSAYGTHKLIIELLLKQKCQQLGLHGAIVRLFSVYGEGLRKQLLWDACQKLQRGEHAFMGSGDEVRDFIHVNDAVETLLLAAKKASPDCPIVNGGTGQATTVRTLLEQLAECLGAPKPSFNGRVNSDNPVHLCADSRLLESWGFVPRISLTKGVADYGKWFMEGCQ